MGPGRLVRPHQWLRFRISGGEDLPGKAEVCLCAGAKLLFLPGRPGSLSHRLSPGGDGQREVSGVLLRVWLPDPLWHLPGAVYLRMAVPLRAGAGSAAPDPHFPQEKESAGPQRPGLSEIWGAGPVCADPAGHGGSDGHRHGGTLVLQVHSVPAGLCWGDCLCWRQIRAFAPRRECSLAGNLPFCWRWFSCR